MDLEELINVFKSIKQDLSEESEALFASFDFFVRNFNDITDIVNKRLQHKISNRDYDDNYIQYAKLLENTYQILTSIDSKFQAEEKNYSTPLKITKTIVSNQNKINYDDYKIDNMKPHSLNEIYTNKRPFGYRFLDSNIIEANTWQKIYIGICEKLIYLDENKFNDLKNIIKGKKPYISEKEYLLRKPFKVSNGLYIETNQSANDLIKNIIKIITKYSFSIEDVEIYLYADYSNLHSSNKDQI